jgi:hypothetical protein
MKTYEHLRQCSTEFFIKRENFQNICRENQNTHFIFNNFFENCAVYERMCESIV